MTVPPDDRLRASSLVAIAAGAIGSLAFLFHASQNPPRAIVALFVLWLSAPFALLAGAHAISTHWPARTKTTLYTLSWVVTLGSLAAFGQDAWGPPHAQAARIFVATPPVALLIVVVVLSAAFLSEKNRG